MARGKQRRSKRSNGRSSNQIALQRPLGGIDQKSFVLNDIVPIVLPNPSNSTTYTCVIDADVNGYTWQLINGFGSPVATGSNPYGVTTGQFGVQALMFTQYYMKSLELDVTLSQGGSTYSMSPLVQFQNPNGATPFILGTGGFTSLLSSPQNTQIHQPYSRHTQHVDYQRWLMAMTDRCWRKTLSFGISQREFYPTDGATDADFVVPSVSTVFQFTIPEGTFAANAGDFVIGVFKTKANYVFSQRRTDIQDLVETERQKITSQAVIETGRPVNFSGVKTVQVPATCQYSVPSVGP